VDLVPYVKRFMGHTSSDTTERYSHEWEDYDGLRDVVEAACTEFDLNVRTPEGLIDARDIVLFRNWRAEGIRFEFDDLPMRPRRTAMPQIGHATTPLALPNPKIIDVVPNSITVEKQPEQFVSLRAKHEAERRRLAMEMMRSAVNENEIARVVGQSYYTIGKWRRDADVAPRMPFGRWPKAEMEAAKLVVAQTHDAHPQASAVAVARMVRDQGIEIEPSRVSRWEKERGFSFKDAPRRAYRVDRFAAEIHPLIVDKHLSDDAIEAELKRRHPKMKTPCASSIGNYRAKVGLKGGRRLAGRYGVGVLIETLDAELRKRAAAGQCLEQIAREVPQELGIASRSGILGYMRRKRIKAARGDTRNRIRKIPEAAE